MNLTPKQREELDLAARFFSALGHPQTILRPSDRPDIEVEINALKIGIEITVFHADETNTNKGSSLRARESQIAKQSSGNSYAMWGVIDPNPALVKRIKDKIEVSTKYNAGCYSEFWLLVSANIPALGAVASTFAIPSFIDVAKLNSATHELLSKSSFSRAYIHTLLSSSLFGWSQSNGWRTVVGVPNNA